MKNLIGITFFLVVVSVYGINPPTLNSPANQANVQGFQTTLIIGGVATATGFQIQFDSVASFNSSWMSINAFTPVGQPQGSQGTISPVLKLNRTYFWRARAFAPNDTSAWTTTRSFATIQTTTFLLGPASNSVGAIQSLRCSNFGNNTLIQYLFEVDTNNTFTSPLRKLSIQSTNQWSDSSLLKFNRTIYWRVTAINNLGDTTNWSPTWKYTTDNGPTLNMGLNQIVNVDPEFNVSWTAVGLSAVQVQFDTVNTFNSPNLLTNLKASGAIQDTFRNLLFDQIYQIRIRAIYNTDTSAWSPTRLCRASTGNVTNPPNGSSVGTITPINLFWTPLKGTSVIMKLYADSALTQLLADTITSAGNYIYRDTLRDRKSVV